ncbi:hypothetical protein [Rhodopirellula bahusiensis]|uniref:Uncharacterized protein n=1 Tax=Rhodopirellula bahusiensis TaxID=2014065 RepID=A0A2G1WE00_9BACT|nr:hypothetical protein [Rhodopirellula bahusiensis]PHQ37248.1 hypothetical protein CEE69_02635 [Rhodopirellula bahusiensis]
MPNYSRIALKMLAAAVETSREESGKKREPVDTSASTPERSWRRNVIGILSAVMLCLGGVFYFAGIGEETLGSASTHAFVTAALLRVGLVLGALWLAWDSLKRPARWLPPGLAVAGVIGIVVVAAQPRLLLAIGPALGVLALLSGVMRIFRSK